MRRALVIILLMMATLASGQSGGPITFSGLNVSDDREVSLSDFKNETGVVVIFTGYECPFDEYYRLRIHELIKTYSGKIQFLLVNPYLEDAESVAQMKMHAVALGYTVPYLADKEQKIMNALSAKKTPEAFLLKRSGNSFTVAYSGSIDDNPQLPSGVKQRYLSTAIENLLSGSAVSAPVRATGCTIRKR